MCNLGLPFAELVSKGIEIAMSDLAVVVLVSSSVFEKSMNNALLKNTQLPNDGAAKRDLVTS